MYKLIFQIHEAELHSTRVYTSDVRDILFSMARAIDAGTACMDVLGNPEQYATVSDVHVYKLINGDYVEISRDTWNTREVIHGESQNLFYLVSWDSIGTTIKHMQRSFKNYDDATMFANGLELMRKQPGLWQMDDVVGEGISFTTIAKVVDGTVIPILACDWILKDEDVDSFSSPFVHKIEKEQTND
jgi:hypothetical protein